MMLLGPSDYKIMPWKNGGGTTTELYVHNASPHGFDWRVSVASVTADGPFSRFPGYDRHIMALDGDGFVLQGGPDGPIDVWPPLTPRGFSGGWDIQCRLRSAPCKDFNLMARHATFRSSMTVCTASGLAQLQSREAWRFLHFVVGGTAVISSGSSIVLEPGESFEIDNPQREITVILCEVSPTGEPSY